jgi:hypothetical protein
MESVPAGLDKVAPVIVRVVVWLTVPALLL